MTVFFSARETVMVETPASCATSAIVGAPSGLWALFWPFFVLLIAKIAPRKRSPASQTQNEPARTFFCPMQGASVNIAQPPPPEVAETFYAAFAT
nr:hypothetical protein [Marinicella sp. W31]MDC2875487.1 hypothetical protein [Marinicella sp. W31]